MGPLKSQWFHDTVSAMVYTLAAGHARDGRPESLPPYNDSTGFILRQHARMPDYLRKPLMAATLGFDSLGLKAGGLFHRQKPEARTKLMMKWKSSGSSFQRDLVRYVESLATLALYSREPLGPGLTSSSPQSLASENVLSSPPQELKCDVAVIGSGPGGSITACLLAEAGRDVLLIEEGPYLPLDSCPPFSATEMEQKYRNGGQTVAMGKDKIAYVEGRCVGGGSEINSGLYHRTPEDMLDRWRKDFVVEGLEAADLAPHFEGCERDVSVSKLKGAAPAASLKLDEGAKQLGWNSLEVPRWFRHNAKAVGGGTRQSMTETFIPRFLKANGRLLPRSRVERLRRETSGWLVSARLADQRRVRVTANAVFLCAGAVQTPAILRQSGMTKNIGDSLQVHPTLKITARFAEEVNSEQMGVPVHQVKEFSPRLSFGCSVSTPPYLALGLIDHPDHAGAVPDSWRCMANYYVMTAGTGSGTVRTLPGFRDPLVRYYLPTGDRASLADGFDKLARLLFEAGATALFPSVPHGTALCRQEDLAQIPEVLAEGMANLMTIHLFSSCPMGERRDRAAVNSFGAVHGQSNLYVNDASLLCSAPGVNPQGTVMALARRNTLRFLGKL